MVALNYSNKKSLESQKKIYKGLRRLLLTKPLSEITITDISVECNISRSTFYRNFNNVVDILDVIFDYYYDRYLTNRVTQSNQLLYFFEYWIMHRDLVSIITSQSPGILVECINKYSKDNMNEENKSLKFDLFSSIISKWSRTKRLDPKEMEIKIKEVFTKKMIDILLD